MTGNEELYNKEKGLASQTGIEGDIYGGSGFSGTTAIDKQEIFEIERINNEIIKEGKKTETYRGSGVTPPELVKKICEDLIKNKKTSYDSISYDNILKTKLCIGALAQEGATSPRFADTRTGEYYNANIMVKDIRDVCKKYNTTYRRLARALEYHAIHAAGLYGIPGNLSKAFKLDYPDASAEELRFASDFLTFSNHPQIPERTKTWLLANYNTRFGGKR